MEKRIEGLQQRILELEGRPSSQVFAPLKQCKNNQITKRSSPLVLPVTYTPVQEDSPKLEIVPCIWKDLSEEPLLFVERTRQQVSETAV